jgi:hypothetical protein
MPHTQEQREEKRSLFTVTVEYSVTSSEFESNCSKGVGMTTNISSKGLCILMNCPLEEGQCVALYGSKLSDGLLSANARWCSKVSDNLYRIGLRLN